MGATPRPAARGPLPAIASRLERASPPGVSRTERVRIELHGAVLAEDLPRIHAFIARVDPAAAERVLVAVEATFEVIANQPECGVRYPTRNPLFHNVRMLPVNEPDRSGGGLGALRNPRSPGSPTLVWPGTAWLVSQL